MEANGLIRATVELIDDDPEVTVPEELAACSILMRRVIGDICAREPEPARRILAEPYSPDAAGWIANRLAELLPLSMPSRHMLMTLTDPLRRLALIHEILQREQVI